MNKQMDNESPRTEESSSDNQDHAHPARPNWKLTLGKWMFVVPFLMFFGAPVVIPLMGFNAGQSAALIGGVVVVAEVIWFASIPLLGKAGFMEMKQNAFSKIKLKQGPIDAARIRLGSRLLVLGLAGQILLHLLMIVGYAIVGAHPERIIFGMSFEQQLAIYFSLLVASVLCTVAGVYAIGADRVGMICSALSPKTDAAA
ncbi:MAG: hypothetical protein ACR2NZ_20825 [Rubripirellula sp.]